MTRLAVVQSAMTTSCEENVARAVSRVEEAADHGAQVVLLPELFEGLYFPQTEREEFFSLAHTAADHPFLPRFKELARTRRLVLPVSFFERSGQAYYNSLAFIDNSGTLRGVYRKSHIPDGPCYEEKFYFNGGDTGFKAWPTDCGTVAAGICWDQWFPESARCMALLGAEVLLYPTAIGSEPEEAGQIDTREMWRRAMIGHAVSNSCYVAAANRVGTEGQSTFYGSSFIVDYRGEMLAEADRQEETILYADLDLSAARTFRASMGFFRDRRPELYAPILTLDGSTHVLQKTC